MITARVHRIEHLPENVLSVFAPMLLGVYHPRLLLITTPSYTFNARFTAPNAPKEARRGYPDPTGRTDRIFRHSDHKFEWTVKEFTEWCNKAAQEWGYEVHVSGVGAAREEDPWGRDVLLGKASQVAAFRRIDDHEGGDLGQMRERKVAAIGTLGSVSKITEHELLATHQHLPSTGIDEAKSLSEISIAVGQVMRTLRNRKMSVHELWSECGHFCGGWLQNLVAAITTTDGFILRRDQGRSFGRWEVELNEDSTDEAEDAVETYSRSQGWGACERSLSWSTSDSWGQPFDDGMKGGWEGTWAADDVSWGSEKWNDIAVSVG